ncbi:hypothetical protein KDW_43220 [Dictyobacter vulcani]|uniref:Proteinase inhibitor I42 chagasin domain-containing protein n=2 Tax=Dictyobacter vulcani TaxID=2607529 RepID=A0A5J4KUK4_9CHLR|nr:hypothetical protein KDW_43220 [Dictyobacter vulcani]
MKRGKTLMNLHTPPENTKILFPGLTLIVGILLSIVLVACSSSSITYQGKTYTITIKPASAGTYTFDQTNFVNQHNLTIVMNDTVTISNSTDQTFTFVTTPAGGPPDGGKVGAKGQTSFQFTRTGTWTIKSKEHPELEMTIVVQ